MFILHRRLRILLKIESVLVDYLPLFDEQFFRVGVEFQVPLIPLLEDPVLVGVDPDCRVNVPVNVPLVIVDVLVVKRLENMMCIEKITSRKQRDRIPLLKKASANRKIL